MVCLVVVSAAGLLAQYTWSAPTLPSTATPEAINNKGDIAGISNDGTRIQAFIRTVDGALTFFDMPNCTSVRPLAGCQANIRGINDSDEVVGNTYNPVGSVLYTNFMRDQNGNVSSLPPPPGATTLLDIFGINDKGQSTVVTGGPQSYQYFLRNADGSYTPLTSPVSGAILKRINNAGQIAGQATGPDLSTTLFLWNVNSGDVTILSNPDTSGPSLTGPVLLNDSGVVVGGLSDGNWFLRNVDGSVHTIVPPASSGAPPPLLDFNSAGTLLIYSNQIGTPLESLGGTIISRTTVSANSDGRLEAFALGSDSALWHKWQTSAGGGWSSWESLGGTLISDPEPVLNADGRIEVFALGADHAVWHTAQTSPGNNVWSAWASLGGYLTGNPAVRANADGRLDVLARGGDSGLWEVRQTVPGGAWGNWGPLGGVLASNPALCANADGSLSALALGSDGSLWSISETSAGAGWGAWVGIGGSFVGDPVAVSNPDGKLQVFARGSDNALWTASQIVPGHWTAPGSLGGVLTSSPVAAINSDGRIEVFAVGTDQALWHIVQASPDANWSTWTWLGGALDGQPDVVRNFDGRIAVFDRGIDQTVETVTQASAGVWPF